MRQLYDNKINIRVLETCLIVFAIIIAAILVYSGLDNSGLIIPLSIVVCVLLILAEHFPKTSTGVLDYCFKHRWLIATLVFIICVILRISGSSIGIYDEIFSSQNVNCENTLFGEPRWIRSDEYGVQAMQFFSQKYNSYCLFSKQMSLAETNMALDYYSPVLNIVAIGKPMMWGYLLFGNEIGLSWYWCSLLILLFMTGLEMLLILTGWNRVVSILGSVMITLSPNIQWWVMPHLPIVILYAMGLFCIGYHFFMCKTTRRKYLFAVFGIIFVVGFAISIYPAIQVPCTYIIIALLIVCLWRDKEYFSFDMSQWYMLVVPALTAIGILLYFVIVSKDGLLAIMNSSYPGQRICTTGGNTWRDLFTDLSSMFLPYKDITYADSNNCEASTYIHFAPFIVIIFPRIATYLKRNASKELPVGITLLVVILFCSLYMCIGIPEFLAKITLLKYCNRMKSIYGWAATLFSIWGFHVLLKYPDIINLREKIIYPLIYAIACILLVNDDVITYFNSFYQRNGISVGKALLIGEIVVLTFVLLLITFGRERLSCGLLIVVMFIAGFTVNPIEKGADAFYNHHISYTIRDIVENEPESMWLCTDTAFYISNYVLGNGAKVLDATNFYKDNIKWEILDSDGVCDEITNRYANESSIIVRGNNKIELLCWDQIRLCLNVPTIKALNVRYLFSTVDYTKLLSEYDITCSQIDSQDGYTIYHLDY